MLTIRHSRQAQAPIKIIPQREIIKPRPVITTKAFISEQMEEIINRVADKHGISADDLFQRTRVRPIVLARREFMKVIHHELRWSVQRIANYLKMDLTTVQYHLGLKKKSKVKYGALNDR